MTALLNMSDVTGGAEVILMSTALCKALYGLDPLSGQGVSLRICVRCLSIEAAVRHFVVTVLAAAAEEECQM